MEKMIGNGVRLACLLAIAVGPAGCKDKPVGDGRPPAGRPPAASGSAAGALPSAVALSSAEAPPAEAPPAEAPPAEAPPAGDAARTLACSPEDAAVEPLTPDPEAGDFTIDEAMQGLSRSAHPVALIETSFGTIRCTLADDKTPRAVANFVGLARGVRPWWDPCGKEWVRRPFYDGLTFHRVIPGFMAQGGDMYGFGGGGPGYTFPSEIRPDMLHDRPGTLAYANSGPDTNGSQFYVTVGTRPQLDGGYVVFGYCEGVEVVGKIVSVPRDGNDMPRRAVVIRSVRIDVGAP